MYHSFLKWPIFTETGKIGSGKNKKMLFFLLGLTYTLKTHFMSKMFSSNSCPELRYQVRHFSACQNPKYFPKVGWQLQFKFLPDPIFPVWVNIGHLSLCAKIPISSISYCFRNHKGWNQTERTKTDGANSEFRCSLKAQNW